MKQEVESKPRPAPRPSLLKEDIGEYQGEWLGAVISKTPKPLRASSVGSPAWWGLEGAGKSQEELWVPGK